MNIDFGRQAPYPQARGDIPLSHMLVRHAVTSSTRSLRILSLLSFPPVLNLTPRHFYHNDGRNHLSSFWIPTGGITKKSSSGFPSSSHSSTPPLNAEDISSLLHRAGYIRQSHAGIFELLPLGLRVQKKLKRLVDEYMRALSASEVSLSTFASEDLWNQSGRLASGVPELFRVKDRKDGKFLLSPTHEEKITQLVKGLVNSHKELPLRLYQVTRKYRDELRPRGGLLRAREFLMKDLYTFDADVEAALETYAQVRTQYRKFFDALKVPYLEAEADSGAIGGDLSHEFHFPSPLGEDTLIQCSACGYVINRERLPTTTEIPPESKPPCPKCKNPHTTTVQAIEVGHTFHLSTRYSVPLNATITLPTDQTASRSPIQMGCHGIGISRLIAASAASLSDTKGLVWPRVIAPFEVVVIPVNQVVGDNDAVKVYDLLAHSRPPQLADADEYAGGAPRRRDVVLDDRPGASLVWKLHDADLIGYPVVVVLGRKWLQSGGDDRGGGEDGEGKRICEIQCRRLNLKQDVPLDHLSAFIDSLFRKL